MARRAADGVEGYQAYRAGNLQEARQLLEGTNQTGDHGAILRGDLYRKLGNWRKAEGWYQAGWEHPVAHERLGKLYEEMRRPEEAIASYRRFAKAWEEADSRLQSRVEKAESRIEALEAKLAAR
jgi:tetratricopeptide (TPR) repeat protein